MYLYKNVRLQIQIGEGVQDGDKQLGRALHQFYQAIHDRFVF